MARFLVVGDLNPPRSPVDRLDMLIFLKHPDVEFYHTGSGKDVLAQQKRPARELIRDALDGKFEFIFAGHNSFPYPNPRKPRVKNYANLAWQVLRYPNLLKGWQFPYAKLGSRLAGLDMADRPVVDNRWFSMLDSCVCFFKRELPANPTNAFLYTTPRTEDNGNVLVSEIFRNRIKKLRPISLGIAPEGLGAFSAAGATKKTDVFFAGDVENKPNRIDGLGQLQRLAAEGYAIDIVRDRIPREEFLQRCSQAYIIWSPEGLGWECLRHYEAALVGSVPMIQAPTIRRYRPLQDGEHALYYYLEGDDLAVRIRQALQNRSRLVEMGQVARKYVLQWHTYDALAKYVIEETRRTAAEDGKRAR
ncbi:MAG TPA: glycosyltransferase [Candidatus Sulfotelmatobacter sp.]|nr:glycosyltransferase [Candidatus Sulfotelmatobacter sp.]